MSTYTRVTITGPGKIEYRRIDAQMTAWLNEKGPGPDHVSSQEDHTTLEWYDRRWGVANVAQFAAAVSRKNPAHLVELFEEWDNRDADEQGATGTRFRGGIPTEYGATEFIWKEA